MDSSSWELKDENGRLRKSLAEKDYEVNYLKKKLDEEKSVMGKTFISRKYLFYIFKSKENSNFNF